MEIILPVLGNWRPETQIAEMVYPKPQHRSATELAKPGPLTPREASPQKIAAPFPTPPHLHPTVKKTLLVLSTVQAKGLLLKMEGDCPPSSH